MKKAYVESGSILVWLLVALVVAVVAVTVGYFVMEKIISASPLIA